MIDEATAREIAGYWHSGQWSAMYMFASSGATSDSRYDVSDIIWEAKQDGPHPELLDLIDYLEGLEA